ncbi:hypothetical protein LCGC14_1657860, partial [marine sediment metagenome]
MKGKTWIITFYLILTFNGCQSIQIVNNEYSDLQGFYRVTIPGESWERIKIN